MDREKDLEKKKPKSEEGGMRYSPRWKLLELKEILYENADENHGITMKDIQAKLMAACGTKPDVKTVYTDLNVLEDYGREKGLEILRPHGRETEYRLIRGENELSYVEIKMLIDTVQSSRFLTKKQSDTIISKLEQLCSVHERKTLNHKVIVANRSKSDNQHILYTMDSIHEAIEENKQIRFQYYGYNMRKEKEYHHYGKEYRVSPFAMIYRDGRYLLLAIPARDTRIRTYRVDRMVNVVVSHAERHNNVTVIPQRVRPVAQMPLHAGRRRRVAAYARVSTDSEEQLTSYEAQVDYYTRYIHAKEETDDWEFVQVYTDEGISATNTKRRDGFNAMVRDALDGKIDLIITKSVSRFARNTVDSLITVRKLKEHGVEVYFEKENIYTLDSKGELLITIMSSLAQEESRSISENVTWGMRKRFADGKVSMPYKRFMGYRKGADGLPEIVEEEAEVVRAIYKRFLEGDTICMITKKLNEQGIPSPAEKKRLSGTDEGKERKTAWCTGTVESILTNEKYKGDALLQKTYCTDFLTKKMKVNEGEVPQYYVQDSHPAIVDTDVFDLVQIELARWKELKGQYSGNGCFASRIVCGDCGHFYGSKVWHSNDSYRKVIWRCNHKYNGQQKCTSPHVTQETLECAFEEVIRRMIAQREHVIAACRLAVKEVLDADDLNREREALEEKLLLLNERIRRLVNDNARTELDQEEYRREYDTLSAQYKQATNRIQEIDEELCGREARKKQIELFLRMFEKQKADVEFDSETFVAMVERVMVSRRKDTKGLELRFMFRNGTEALIRI